MDREEQTLEIEFGGDVMNKKELVYIAILTLLIAFMDISGIPSTFFVTIQKKFHRLSGQLEWVYFSEWSIKRQIIFGCQLLSISL